MKRLSEDDIQKGLKLITFVVLVFITTVKWINHHNTMEIQESHVRERIDLARFSLDSMTKAREHNVKTLSTLAAHQVVKLGLLQARDYAQSVEQGEELQQLLYSIGAQVVLITDAKGNVRYQHHSLMEGYETPLTARTFFQGALQQGYGHELLMSAKKRELRFFSAVYLGDKGGNDEYIVFKFQPTSYAFWVAKETFRILMLDNRNVGFEIGTKDRQMLRLVKAGDPGKTDLPVDVKRETLRVENSYLNYFLSNGISFVRMSSVPQQLYIEKKISLSTLKNWHFIFYVDASQYLKESEGIIQGWFILVLVCLLFYLMVSYFTRHHFFVRGLAYIDPMTELFNRKHLEESSPGLLELHDRGKIEHLGIIMLDIDKFKLINDTYGHDAGDNVIKGLAKLIREGSRKSDQAYRLGGEEFLVVCQGEDIKGLAKMAERLRQKVESTGAKEVGIVCPFTISVGIAERSRNEAWQALMIRADKKLYQAKLNGRNLVVE